MNPWIIINVAQTKYLLDLSYTSITIIVNAMKYGLYICMLITTNRQMRFLWLMIVL